MSRTHKEHEVCQVCEVGQLELVLKDRVLRYQGAEKTLTGLRVYQCVECGESFYTAPSKKKVNREFADLRRKVEGLLTSEEIVHFRKQYQVTQEELSGLLGMAPKTIARYESGFAIQSRQVDLMLRLLIKDPSNCRVLSALVGIALSEVWNNAEESVSARSPQWVPLFVGDDEFPQEVEKSGDNTKILREYTA